MGESKVSAVLLHPVFRLPADSIWSEDFPLQLYRLYVKVIGRSYSAEPNVFAVVFPVRLCTAPFFALPSNPIANAEVLFEDGGNQQGCIPVGTDINGCILL